MNMIAKSKFVKSVMITFMAILIVFSQFLFGVASPAFAANNSCKNQQSTEVLATVGIATIAAAKTIAIISAHATWWSASATVLTGGTAAVLAAPVVVAGGAALATYAVWEAFSPDCDSQKIAANPPKHNGNLLDKFSQRK
ncbi:hypothetical protein ACL6C3_06625 [Capilliphycus salinus ALCB114379]|uniref:hypothetical protein n=1 Tax=Capilliphycus salinus TaxID=2768948 RepID=UPI0039A6C9DE